jgi:hypothetical protein
VIEAEANLTQVEMEVFSRHAALSAIMIVGVLVLPEVMGHQCADPDAGAYHIRNCTMNIQRGQLRRDAPTAVASRSRLALAAPRA